MDPFGSKALALATTVASLLAFRAVRKKSLTPGGAAVGFAVGFLLVATGLRGMVLFFFYQLGSWATKYKKQLKESMDATVAHSSVRSGAQVLAVSLVAVLLSLFHAYYYGAEQAIDFAAASMPSRLTTAVLAHHAVSFWRVSWACSAAAALLRRRRVAATVPLGPFS